MHYHHEDVAHLLQRLPAMTLMSASRFQTAWAAVVESGAELAPVLQQYPQVRYEPLDLHYSLRQALTLTDEALVQDLCVHYGWSGVLSAALLAALAPSDRYTASLAAGLLRVRDPWLVSLAIARCEGQAIAAASAAHSVLEQLASQVACMPTPAVKPLRRVPSEAALLDRRAAVERAYRAGGAKAALAVLTGPGRPGRLD